MTRLPVSAILPGHRRFQNGPIRRTGNERTRAQTAVHGGSGAKDPVALDLDDPPRQLHPREEGRPQGRRPPGVVGVPRDPDDGTLFSCAASRGPRRRQAAREPSVSRHTIPAGPPVPGQFAEFP